ncbi:WD repeat-containing protein 25 isoform X1 [Erinaceus europaeus]|uniref:WD repeat-containing protein 25 isoform X1 n=1 Tax=Erinaceus europaeus TaxID=9365 RepID=A0ABM3WKD7_ERIEU|nr:WD repeat-containing protein 25 isoform X1 [Erinaceus europaeus]
MTSLVAYEDSGSESEPEHVGGPQAAARMTGALDVDIPGESAAGPPGPGSCATQASRPRLPLARLGRIEPGPCPSQRLQWPRPEPDTPVPTRAPSRPSLWASPALAGPGPLAATPWKRGPRPREPRCSPQTTLCAQPPEPAPGPSVSPLPKRRAEDCVVPYTPKRLRQLQAPSREADASGEGAEQGSAPGPLPGPPRVSAFLEPYLDSPYQETLIPKKLLFQLRGHGGPVNSIQWCPARPGSHMLLSASMDKTFKVWDAVDAGRCLQTYSVHGQAVRAARWSPCGRSVLSGGFDCALRLTDLETGSQLLHGHSGFRITALKFHPKDHNVFLCGGFSSEIKAWDLRAGKVVKGYKAAIQQTLDILFLQEGTEFLSSTDASSRDSADRTIIAWDFRSSAKISNQIYHERYTCPSLALHPKEPVFLAQTNGNYLALFSAVWPYRMSRRRRYEGHKVEGYSVGCECSPDGVLLVTGSADGRVLLHTFRTASRARTLHAHPQACLGTRFHPVLPSVLATSSWEGDIKIWH